tara:strand:+ start:1416 stop:1748 length:333 start_codon:yes stop_codon:yes gene_type:complete
MANADILLTESNASVIIVGNGDIRLPQTAFPSLPITSFQWDPLRDKEATVIVDMSGNSVVLNALNEHLDDNLSYCIYIGLTYWDEASIASVINPKLGCKRTKVLSAYASE